MNLSTISKGDHRKFSDIGAWYTIEDCAQYDKKCSNPTSAISDETIANPNSQIVRDDMVRVQVPRCMAWLDYDEHVDSLSMMDNKVGVTSLESTTQTLPSFEEYTPPMTYSEEVEKTLGTLIEVEPLSETKLEEVGLNCNHNTPFSSREVHSFDGLEPQPLLNILSLDVGLGDVIGPEPPIKPHSPDSSKMKVVDYLTTQTPPSPHVANSHPNGVYCYYNPGEELSLFDRPNEVERSRILEAHRLESILEQQISQRMAPSHHNDMSRRLYCLGRKAYLLEDKQISSVGVFDEVFNIWKAFGGNKRDLGSFGEEIDKTTNLHQHLSRISTQKLETASQITRDAVTTHLKTASQDFHTASDKDNKDKRKQKQSKPTRNGKDKAMSEDLKPKIRAGSA
ncbi:hypothetical protein Tco_0928036 [Tanacetum coccineum]